jgi:iron complex transport system ATP-binding protein
MIKIKNVSVKRAEKEILKNVSWLVKKGEHWCLLGLNGSGKTTLLNIINGYIWPTKGQVEVLSRKFGETNLSELRKEIGWVSSSLQQRFQDDDTVLEMILSGKFASIGLYEQVEQKDMNQAIELMKLLNCEDLQNQAPASANCPSSYGFTKAFNT